MAEHPHAWKMLCRDTTGDSDIRAFRGEVQTRAREVMVAVLEAQQDSADLTGSAPSRSSARPRACPGLPVTLTVVDGRIAHRP